MKKYILLIAIVFLSILTPTYVNALTEVHGYALGSKTDYTTNIFYKGSLQNPDKSVPLFCLDAKQINPTRLDTEEALNPSSSYHRALIAIYRAYLINGGGTGNNLTYANDAMRILTISTNNSINYNATGIDVNKYKKYNPQSDKNQVRAKFYCAGLSAYYKQSKVGNCKDLKNYGLDLSLLTLNNFSFKVEEVTVDARKVHNATTNQNGYSKEIKLKLNKDNNLYKVLNAYSQLRDKTTIKLTGCTVDENSKKAGFTCKIVSGNQETKVFDSFENSYQTIAIENNNKLTSSTKVKVSLSYKVVFPYDASSLTMLKCSKNGTNCRPGTSYGYAKKPDNWQRFLIVNFKGKQYDAKTEVSIDVPEKCIRTGNTCKVGEQVVNCSEYDTCKCIKKDNVCTIDGKTVDCSQYDNCIAEKPKCQKKDNKYYDNEGNDVSLEKMLDSCCTSNVRSTLNEEERKAYDKKCSCFVDSTKNEFYYQGTSYNNLSDLLEEHKKECCNAVNVNKLTDEQKNVYDDKCVVKRCEYTDGQYKVNGETVEFKKYIDSGCCEGIDPNNLNNDDKATYNAKCVPFSYTDLNSACGVKDKIVKETLGDKVNKLNGSDVTTTTCSVESYVDYSKSVVANVSPEYYNNYSNSLLNGMSAGMSKVLERVKTLENSAAYNENLSGIYSHSSIVLNTDTSYLQNQINPRSNSQSSTTLAPISTNNNYCTLLTTETNEINMPGTTVAKSGEFFVFAVLDKEECLTSPEPSAECYRQPNVKGTIYVTMHTNVTKWLADVNSALDTMATKDPTSSEYITAKTTLNDLIKFKKECEAHNKIEDYWTYNLEPNVTFKYSQAEHNASKIIESQALEMYPTVSGDAAVKYWPNVTTSESRGNKVGTESKKQISKTINGENINIEYDETENYSMGVEKTVYYRPKKINYVTMRGDIVAVDKFQSTANMIEKSGNEYIEVGYVYNVSLTTYQGAYTTSFTINNLGYSGAAKNINTKNDLQQILEDHQENGKNEFTSECVYCNQESVYERECLTCPDPDPEEEIKFNANFIYRTISLSNVTPQKRAYATNWSDTKGETTKKYIEDRAGDNIISMLSKDATEEINTSTLDQQIDKNNLTVKPIVDDIYDDNDKDYLEYEIELNTKDMKEIKESNKTIDYGEINICRNQNEENCFTCNADSKECISRFVTKYSKDESLLRNTRENKWKYFFYNTETQKGEWKIGSMEKLKESFSKITAGQKYKTSDNSIYPDPSNKDAWLNIYMNWP